MSEIWNTLVPEQTVHLAPWAWILVESSTPLGSFAHVTGVTGDVMAALNTVRDQLRACIESTIGDVASGRLRFDDPRLPRLMEDAYAEVVASHPHLALLIQARRRRDGGFDWSFPRDPDYLPDHRLDRLRLINVVQREVSGGELRALSSEAVGWLSGELQGRHTARSLQRAVTARPEAERLPMEKLLGNLHRVGSLLQTPGAGLRRWWLDHTRDGDVVHLGHAALMARIGEEFIYFDPWLVPWLSEVPAASLWPSLLPAPAAIFFTHEHDDHLDRRAMMAFPKDTPIIVPAPRDGASFHFDYEGFLRRLGFTRVVPLEHGERWTVGPAEVEAVPFYGEDPCDVDLPRNCYLLADRGRNTLMWADSGPNNAGRSALVDGVVDDLVRRWGKVHLLLSSQQQIKELRALSVYVALCPPGTWFQAGENGYLTDEYLTEVVARSGARQFVSYATGGADWLPGNTSFAFGWHNPARAALITAAWRPLETLRAPLQPLGCAWHYARATDIYRPRADGGTDILSEVAELSPAALFEVDHPRPTFLDRLPRLGR